MAMNGNEGGSAYPPNPDVKSGSCLIAGFQPLTVFHPSYWNAYKAESGATFSIDMVRLKLSFINGKGEWLSTHAQTFDCDSMSAWTSKIRPGGWYELWSFELGDSSVALGIGFMEPSCKVNMHKGFIEFNPNKVAGDKRFHGLLKTLGTCVSKARLKRFDLAYDIPVSRYDCRLSKDRRMYKSVISNGITEYLGVKNTPAYVKVYDKAAELHLDTDKVQLTRIEMTCDGEWTAEQLEEHWPQVHAWRREPPSGVLASVWQGVWHARRRLPAPRPTRRRVSPVHRMRLPRFGRSSLPWPRCWLLSGKCMAKCMARIQPHWCFPSQSLIENAFRTDIPDYL